MAGDYSKVTYTLSDMAADTVGLMDALGFESVHLVGASMGGMIAQTIAIEYPKRVRSLTSMMTTTGANGVGLPDFATLAHLGPPPQDDREGYIEWMVKSLKAIGSTKYDFDEAGVRDRVGRSWDRDHDPLVMLRHSVSVLKSGDRTEKLKMLNVPALIIHGDSDKMCHMSGGEATASAIPGAELVIIEGMGHGLPRGLWTKFSDLISNLVQKVEVGVS